MQPKTKMPAATRNVLVGLLTIVWVACAKGDTIYAYTGNDYTNCAGNYCSGGPYALDVTFDTTLTGAALDNLSFTNITGTVQSFSFSDGTGLVVNQSTSGVSDEFEISTDAAGNIVNWFVGGYANSAQTQMQTNWHSPIGFTPGEDFSETTVSFGGSYGYVSNDPGIWKLTASTPEPRWATLLGVGLLLLFAMRMRRKRLAHPVR
jgi:hypothetical protein